MCLMSLPEGPEGIEARDEAVQRVEENTDPAWKAVAERFVHGLPVEAEFTTDRVWFHLERASVTTPEPRALGAIMLALSRAGVIEKTGRYIQTTRPKAHARPIPVWRRT